MRNKSSNGPSNNQINADNIIKEAKKILSKAIKKQNEAIKKKSFDYRQEKYTEAKTYYLQATNCYDSLLELDYLNTTQYTYNKVKILFHLAEIDYDLGNNIEPNVTENYKLLCYNKAMRTTQNAIEHCIKSLTDSNDKEFENIYISLLLLLGNIYKELGFYSKNNQERFAFIDKAIECCNQVLTKDNNNIKAMFGVARSWFSIGEIIKFNPSNFRLNNRDNNNSEKNPELTVYKNAINFYNKILEIEPENEIAQKEKARSLVIFVKLKDLATLTLSIEDYKKLLSYCEEILIIYNNDLTSTNQILSDHHHILSSYCQILLKLLDNNIYRLDLRDKQISILKILLLVEESYINSKELPIDKNFGNFDYTISQCIKLIKYCNQLLELNPADIEVRDKKLNFLAIILESNELSNDRNIKDIKIEEMEKFIEYYIQMSNTIPDNPNYKSDYLYFTNQELLNFCNTKLFKFCNIILSKIPSNNQYEELINKSMQQAEVSNTIQEKNKHVEEAEKYKKLVEKHVELRKKYTSFRDIAPTIGYVDTIRRNENDQRQFFVSNSNSNITNTQYPTNNSLNIAPVFTTANKSLTTTIPSFSLTSSLNVIPASIKSNNNSLTTIPTSRQSHPNNPLKKCYVSTPDNLSNHNLQAISVNQQYSSTTNNHTVKLDQAKKRKTTTNITEDNVEINNDFNNYVQNPRRSKRNNGVDDRNDTPTGYVQKVRRSKRNNSDIDKNR